MKTVMMVIASLWSVKALAGEIYCSLIDIQDGPSFTLRYESKKSGKVVTAISESTCSEGNDCTSSEYKPIQSSPYNLQWPFGKYVAYDGSSKSIFVLDRLQEGHSKCTLGEIISFSNLEGKDTVEFRNIVCVDSQDVRPYPCDVFSEAGRKD